jgi:hypothetical protein
MAEIVAGDAVQLIHGFAPVMTVSSVHFPGGIGGPEARCLWMNTRAEIQSASIRLALLRKSR